MKVEEFRERLPSLYSDWGGGLVRPLSGQFEEALQRVRGMTTASVLQLLNLAVECLEPEELYCEIGSFQGATLIGALLDHAEVFAYAVDNFIEFDPQGTNHRVLMQNLAAFKLQAQVRFFNQDFEEFLLKMRGSRTKLGVYFYDGAHDYRSQMLGLLLAVPFLARRALLIVDDSNFPAVKQATWDFLAVRPECRMLFDLPTPGNCHPTFWNGVCVLAWDAEGTNGHDWLTVRKARQPALLESLHTLQFVNVRRQGQTIQVTPAQ